MIFRNDNAFAGGWLYFIMMFCFALILPESFGDENGVIENIQLLWLVAGMVYCWRMRSKKVRSWGGDVRALGFGGALYFFLLFMREISWGRVLFTDAMGNHLEYSQMGLYGKMVHPMIGVIIVLALFMLYRAKIWKMLVMIKLPYRSLLLLALFITFAWVGEKHILTFIKGQLLEELAEFGAYMMMFFIVKDLGQRLQTQDSGEVIAIHEDSFVGKGAFKAVYVHPNDNKKVVKVPFNGTGEEPDTQREMTYRRIRKLQGKKSELLTDYHGESTTEKGKGFVYERVVNDDGTASLTLKEYMEQQDKLTEENYAFLKEVLSDFGHKYIEEKIVTSNMELVNFMLQKKDGKVRVRIVDNIGTPSKIPLAYVSDHFAQKRAKKYWKRFVDEISKAYPQLMTVPMADKNETLQEILTDILTEY